jgi:uncharacterized phage protein (TIGR01671 family)
MREIIFRAWWKDDNTLVDPKSYVIYPDGTIEFPEGGWDLQGWDSSDLVILEQYTGLKDRNGKMIFEGDIVKITYHSMEETFDSCGSLVTMLMTRTYEVFWNVTKWSIKSLEPMLTINPPIFDLPTNHVTYEIIGNIHEEERK